MTSVGFVGLGHMGGNMAARLHSAGYEVYGNEREREHARALEEVGLRWCDTPREVAKAAEIAWGSKIRSWVLVVVYAAALYSLMRPPRSSCLWMWIAGARTSTAGGWSGGWSESERCGLCRL